MVLYPFDVKDIPPMPETVYCKYCHEDVVVEVNVAENLVECSDCHAGLAPLDRVVKAGSYEAFLEQRTV